MNVMNADLDLNENNSLVNVDQINGQDADNLGGASDELVFGAYPSYLSNTTLDSFTSDTGLMDTVTDRGDAMDQISQSEKAMDKVTDKEMPMDKVTDSNIAMDKVTDSETAMDAVSQSDLARDEVTSSSHRDLMRESNSGIVETTGMVTYVTNTYNTVSELSDGGDYIVVVGIWEAVSSDYPGSIRVDGGEFEVTGISSSQSPLFFVFPVSSSVEVNPRGGGTGNNSRDVELEYIELN